MDRWIPLSIYFTLPWTSLHCITSPLYYTINQKIDLKAGEREKKASNHRISWGMFSSICCCCCFFQLSLPSLSSLSSPSLLLLFAFFMKCTQSSLRAEGIWKKRVGDGVYSWQMEGWLGFLGGFLFFCFSSLFDLLVCNFVSEWVSEVQEGRISPLAGMVNASHPIPSRLIQSHLISSRLS